MKFLIVSGGSLNKEFVTKVVGQGRYDRILAADSGMNALYAAAVTPDIIIGDFDSLSDAEKVNVYKQASDSVPPIDDLRTISPFRVRVYESEDA